MTNEDIRLFGYKGVLNFPGQPLKSKYYKEPALTLQPDRDYVVYLLCDPDNIRASDIWVEVGEHLLSLDGWPDKAWSIYLKIPQQEFTMQRIHKMLLWLYKQAEETNRELCNKIDRERW